MYKRKRPGNIFRETQDHLENPILSILPLPIPPPVLRASAVAANILHNHPEDRQNNLLEVRIEAPHLPREIVSSEMKKLCKVW